MAFTIFFIFYILNLLESVNELIEKVQEQFLRYKNLVEFIHGVFIIVDEKLNISFTNNGILDLKQEDLEGKNLTDFPFFDSKVIEELKRTKERQKYEWSYVNTDGETSWYIIDVCIQYSSSKNCNEIALLLQDVSLEKKIKEKEKNYLLNLSALKAKNEFIASISHEIRNPLQVISYNTENLLSKNLTSQVKETVKDIQNATSFLTTVIGDILDHSKIEAGEMKIVDQEFELLPLIESSIKMNTRSFLKKGLKFKLNFDFSLPKFFLGDSSRILQIMNNFISNAIKYTQKGNIKISMTSSYDFSNHYLLFECQDTGIGISQENLKTLFDPFVQVYQKKQSPTKFKGWGLGLSICKKLLNLMNGEFGVTSELGKGSIFWFKLPFKNIENNIIYQEEFKKLPLAFEEVAVIHSDENIIADIVKYLQMTNIKKIETNMKVTNDISFDLKKNRLFFVENSLLNHFPAKIGKQRIIEISNEFSSNYQQLKYPILPSSLFKILGKVKTDIESNLFSSSKREELQVLIVDDNPLILKSLERLLKTLEVCNIKKAADGKEAVDIVSNSETVFDIIFMDISMPVMDGIEATEFIRNLKDKKKRNTLIYALTGNALSTTTDQQKKEWKMNEILSKPVNKKELNDVLKKL